MPSMQSHDSCRAKSYLCGKWPPNSEDLNTIIMMSTKARLVSHDHNAMNLTQDSGTISTHHKVNETVKCSFILKLRELLIIPHTISGDQDIASGGTLIEACIPELKSSLHRSTCAGDTVQLQIEVL